MLVSTAFGIIHNCAKLPANAAILQSCDLVGAAGSYTDMKHNAREIVLEAAMAISAVMEENQAHVARLSEG